MTPFLAEIVGTGFLLLLGLGVVANVLMEKTYGNGGGWLVITTAWGLSVFVGVMIAGPYSGAHLNPAVTIGLAAAGKFAWSLVPSYILAQFIGAMIGAFLVWLLYRDHFNSTEDKDSKLGVFCTSPAISNNLSNVFSEAIGTFALVFGVLYITGATIEGTDQLIGLGSVGALPVAFLVWVIGLALGGTTGYAINPARDLGPRIMHQILPFKTPKSNGNWAYAWIPVVGPILGAFLAAGLDMLIQ
ncbi:MAG: aquaporin family protein [Saprospiraceae bacterium]|nr:aquaporin family protein [Saprospiraceae bacterium]